MFKSTRSAFSFSIVAVLLATLGCGGCGGCSGGGGKTSDKNPPVKPKQSSFMKLGSAPSGASFFPVGTAITEALNKNAGDNNWEFSNSSTNGSQANIRLLEKGELDIALSNSAITYFAVRGESGWDKAYEMRAVVTLAPLVAMFISRADSDVKTIQDLKSKRVTIGPSGAGFKMFVEPILNAHGVNYEDFQVKNAPQTGAVENLADGTTDAAFVGGAIPTGSIQNATGAFDVHFVPFEAGARKKLIENYPFFDAFTIPAKTYKGMDTDFVGLNVGSMHVITSKSMDEEVIYQITKTIWDNRAAIRGTHAAGRAINKSNAARYTGTEFHPGAIRFYKEIGIWKDPATQKKEAAKKEAAKKEASKKDSK